MGLTLGTPARQWRTIASALVAALMLATVLAGCGTSAEEGGVSVPPAADTPADVSDLARAIYAGQGRYVAIQDFESDGTPIVVAWDSAAQSPLEQVRVVRGYVLLRAEVASAKLWLQPATADDVEMTLTGDGVPRLHPTVLYGWAYDGPPSELAVWDLDSEDGPTNEVAAKWDAWSSQVQTFPYGARFLMSNQGSFLAYPEVDVLTGVAPARVLVNGYESNTEGLRVELPDAVVTVQPIGWSADRFVVQALTQVSVSGEDSGGLPQGDIYLIDARTGDVEQVSSSVTPPRSAAAIAPGSGSLIVPTLDGITVHPLSGGSREITLLDETATTPSVRILGASETDVLIALDGQEPGLVRITGPDDDVEPFDEVSSGAEVFGPAGLVFLRHEVTEEDSTLVAYVVDIRTGDGEEIWRSGSAGALD